MEKKHPPKYYVMGVTQEDFDYPRFVPLWKKPFQPPTRTGERYYCPEPPKIPYCDELLLKEREAGTPATFDIPKLKKKSSDNLIKRRDILRYPGRVHYTHYMPDSIRLKSTHQIAYGQTEVTFDDLMRHLSKAARRDLCMTEAICNKLTRKFWDPVPFKRRVDKGPLLG